MRFNCTQKTQNYVKIDISTYKKKIKNGTNKWKSPLKNKGEAQNQWKCMATKDDF